jgi:thiol-disulfide isomerase/thioredoxin
MRTVLSRVVRRAFVGCAAAVVLAVWLMPALLAQAPGVPIERAVPLMRDPQLLERAEALRAAGKLLGVWKVDALLESPAPAKLALPAPGTKPLGAREVYRLARAACVRVGWYYRCPNCDEWHLSLSGGFAITADGAVATAQHSIEPDEDMVEGFLVAVTLDGTVLPVTTVLAADAEMDAAIVRVADAKVPPLPLSDQTAPGDPVFVFSDPFDVRGYFSTGTVNRFFWADEEEGDPMTLAGAAKVRMNVSADFALGSSGSAVVDACGNAIGHVVVIEPLSEANGQEAEEPREPAPEEKGKPKGAAAPDEAEEPPPDTTPLITLHEAVPARGLMLLAQAATAAAAKPATARAKPEPPAANAAELAARIQKAADALEAAREEEDEALQERKMRRALRHLAWLAAELRTRFPDAPERWMLPAMEVAADDAREDLGDPPKLRDPVAHLRGVLDAADAPPAARMHASHQLLALLAAQVSEEEAAEDGKPAADPRKKLEEWEQALAKHQKDHKDDNVADLLATHLDLVQELAPARAEALAEQYAKHPDEEVAEPARTLLEQARTRRELAKKPIELRFTALDGREVDVAKLRGKVVLVDFWATWCGPCMAEMPRVVEAYAKLHGRGLEIVGISLDEDRAELEKTLKAKKVPWPQCFSGKGWDDPLVERFGINGIPTMWLVNRAGLVVDWDAREKLPEKAEKLLAEPAK